MPIQFYSNPIPGGPPPSVRYPAPQPVLTVPPTTTLASLDEVKAYRGIEDDSQDVNLQLCLDAESNLLEKELDWFYRPQTWVQTEYCFRPFIKLVRAPVVSVSVSYFDKDNAQQTWATTEYELRKFPFPALVLAYGKQLPTTYPRQDAVSITIVCGGIVPPEVKQLCCARVGDAHEHREYSAEGTLLPTPGYERQTRLLRRGLI